jgi:hypothetical protein
MTYTIDAIAPDVVRALLTEDDAGAKPWRSIDDEGGAPMRCCLRYSEPGDQLALASYAPLRRWAAATGADPGPYDEQGPVFLHADGCPGPVAGSAYPGARQRVFRRYSADGRILGGRLVGADEDHPTVLAEMFAEDDRTELIHVRAVEFGCFLYQAGR